MLLFPLFSVEEDMTKTAKNKEIKTSQTTGNARAVIYTIILSQFGFAFSINVILSFMPFYILDISQYSKGQTMVWIGLIMGMNSFFMAAAAPFWGAMTSRFSSRMLYERVFLISGFIVLLMGFTKSLPVLLALRIIQGTLGGSSTIGLFMVSRLSSREKLAANISLYQNSITAGQLLSPPVGAYIVVHMGYTAPFILSSLLIFSALLLCHLHIADIGPGQPQSETKNSSNRQVVYGWAISFIATINLTFLPSILPSILEGFSLRGDAALKSAGFIMMGYTATAIIGNYLISNLTPAARIKKTIVAACLFSALLQFVLYLTPGVVYFTAVRMLQTGAIAAVISLVMSKFAGEVGGGKIGFLNSARFAGNGAGPMLATFILARGDLLSLYLVIALSTAGSALAFLYSEQKSVNSSS
jgi:DHA1 family multidrug resistance protein-like MFS transporter